MEKIKKKFNQNILDVLSKLIYDNEDTSIETIQEQSQAHQLPIAEILMKTYKPGNRESMNVSIRPEGFVPSKEFLNSKLYPPVPPYGLNPKPMNLPRDYILNYLQGK